MALASFDPAAVLGGGALIGLAAAALMLLTGRIAGISGMTVGLLPPAPRAGLDVRAGFVAGLAAAPFVWVLLIGGLPEIRVAADGWTLAAAGLLVGFGAVWGAGCTSGHGVCGLARLSPRSAAATATFMAAAAATVALVRALAGGA